jgi:hypothetical protein
MPVRGRKGEGREYWSKHPINIGDDKKANGGVPVSAAHCAFNFSVCFYEHPVLCFSCSLFGARALLSSIDWLNFVPQRTILFSTENNGMHTFTLMNFWDCHT